MTIEIDDILSLSSFSYKTDMLKRHVKTLLMQHCHNLHSVIYFNNKKKIHTEVFIPNQRPERYRAGWDETPSDKCEYSNDQTLHLN